MPARLLTVNADDFGFTHDVNRGIVETHTHGILTATTLMANGDAFDDAVRLARATPTLDVGVHFVLVGGESVLEPGRALPATVSELLKAVALRRIRVYDELRAQIGRIVAAGIRPTHVDSHKHTHLLPAVLEAVARLAEEFGVAWVRRPFDLPLGDWPAHVPLKKNLVGRSFHHLVGGQFARRLGRHGRHCTDYFAGFQITGRYTAEDLLHLFDHLPEGSTEFMAHPGYCTAELRGADTRLKESREAELGALTDPRVRQRLEQRAIRLTRYADLPR